MHTRFILTFILLFTSLCIQAQVYRRIPSSGAYFKVGVWFDESPTCSYVNIGFIYTDGDTLVDSLLMTKLMVSPTFTCSSSGPSCGGPEETGGLKGFLYQDSLGRVYSKRPGSSSGPMLQFDFSLGIGDSVTTYDYYESAINYTVSAVDTVVFIDGIPRKRLVMDSPCLMTTANQSIWVEGIGDLYYGYFPFCPFESWEYALCYREDSFPHLADGWPDGPCFGSPCTILVGQEEPQNPSIMLSPNPSSAGFFISGMKGPFDAAILDVFGHECLKQSCPNSRTEISAMALSPGIYWVQVVQADGTTEYIRWVKL